MANLKAPKHRTLKPNELKWTCGTKSFDFSTVDDLKPIEGIVGQERAMKALKLGVELRSAGYNVFITGLSGTGKLTAVKKMLEVISPDCPTIYDYAYVNNFEDEDRPMLLKFKAGSGVRFRRDMENAISFLHENIPHVLESESYKKKKQKLIGEFSKSQQNLLSEFEEKLKKDDLVLGQVKIGEMTRPDIMFTFEDQQYLMSQLEELVTNNKITKQKKDKLIKKYTEYQDELQNVFRKGMQLNQDFKDKLKDVESSEVTHIIAATFDHLKKKYPDKKVEGYLDSVVQNIKENLEVFKGQQPVQEESASGLLVDYLKPYEVNVILDNSKQKECPVVIETSPTFTNLFGAIDKISDGRGGWYADFTRIKSGSLLRANGGYIVINAMDAFSEPGVWKTLKRALLYGKMEIQDVTPAYQFSPSVLKPESIELNTKVLFIGSNYIYSLLSGYEDDFNKIFKIKAEFDYEMKRSDQAINEYARVIKKLINEEKLRDFEISAISKLVEHGARYAGEKNKLTTRFAYIADLAREASFWAGDNGDKKVNAYHVEQAYNALRDRHGIYESKVNEMLEDGTLLIDTEGTRVGQINGLAVYGSSQFSFGKPTRITASVSLGNGSIINVEREAGLSGSSHNKGVLIISGYFKQMFGSKLPLSFNASLVFEQGYGMIDGDSASITEICALASCLSDIPIKQSIAITGSVNQKGDIQPIGGVNEKIEGFFDLCKARGLKKEHGVIIPEQNVKDLMLKDEVIEAVEKKQFSIYPVKKVEEAIEILTGTKASKLTRTGSYRANTVFGVIEKRLKKMREIVKPGQKRRAQSKKKTTTRRKKKSSK